MRDSYAASIGLAVDVLLVDAARGATAALRIAGLIVAIATATAKANRIRCCLAVIRSCPETRTRLITIEHFAQRRYPPSGIVRSFSDRAQSSVRANVI